jgi:pilus assembly protein Flp/PilA
MTKFFARFLSNESGATAIEYALIAATMAVVLVAGMAALGPKVESTFTTIAGYLP